MGHVAPHPKKAHQIVEQYYDTVTNEQFQKDVERHDPLSSGISISNISISLNVAHLNHSQKELRTPEISVLKEFEPIMLEEWGASVTIVGEDTERFDSTYPDSEAQKLGVLIYICDKLDEVENIRSRLKVFHKKFSVPVILAWQHSRETRDLVATSGDEKFTEVDFSDFAELKALVSKELRSKMG